MGKYEDREWIICKELQAPGEVGDVITFGMYPTYEEAMEIFNDLHPMGLKVWIERNREPQKTSDDIIVSIKARLGELDLEIRDAKKRLSNYSIRLGWDGYWAGELEAFETEKETLQKIMRGKYGNGNRKGDSK